jgi:thymidine phosphorylase
VLSKKIAAGATHVVLDVPVGQTAKVRTAESAGRLSRNLVEVAKIFGLDARIVVGDGSQPIGRGIGPALEARDVMAVLRNDPNAPADLKTKAVTLSSAILEMAGIVHDGWELALETLDSGRAWQKFQRICEAQGGMRVPPLSNHRHEITAVQGGRVAAINNRKLARVAKLAGAPDAKAAGVELGCRLGAPVAAGEPLYTVHAEAPGELDYSLAYVAANPDIVVVGEQ